MRDKVAKRLGMEVILKTRRTVEITMSEDWAECIAHQAEEVLEAYKPDIVDHVYGHHQELHDLVSLIDEVLR